MLMAGTCIFCLDGARSGQMKSLIESTDDGTLLRKLQEANKYIFSSLLQGSMGGSIDSSYEYEDTLMWWQSMLIAFNVVFGVLAAAGVAMYVISRVRGKNDVKEGA